MRLVNVYKYLFPLELANPVTSRTGKRSYKYLARIERKKDAPPITLEALQKYVDDLKERMRKKYGDEVAELFYLGKRTIDGKTYYFIGRKRKRVGTLKTTERIPVYFDINTNEAYIPQSYLKKKPQYVSYVLMTVLGALGQTQKRSTGKRIA